MLLDTGAELVAGSTRMGAATAQKIALNMISTLAGLMLGHVHDGYMVNVVADNAKLRGRAARIVAEWRAPTRRRPRRRWRRRAARSSRRCSSPRGPRGPGHADRLLAESGGHLGAALEALRAGQ